MFKRVSIFAIMLSALIACSVSPVTGKRHFSIYGSDWENQVGGQMYTPLKQSQGGDFILDRGLTEYVNEVGNRLASQARRKEELGFEFSVLNDSTPNAWALPGGKIVINRGLLTRLDSEAELAAVLGHEIVHADAAHGARQQSTGMLAQVGTIVSMVVLSTQVENEQARQIAMLVPQVGAQLIMTRYGRDAERESDEYGMLYMAESGYSTQGAVELQETFVELSKGRNQDWLSGLFASHPPSMERLQNNRETAATMPLGGTTGRDRYRQKTAFLRKVQPAYDAYDEAGKALSEGDIKLAQKNLNRALAIEPRESLFKAMQGDIYKMEGNTSKANSWYSQAIKANPNLYYGYLRKGQIEYQNKNSKAAQSNLLKSVELLPTAEATYMLGMIDKSRGNTDQAMQYFSQAAQSNTKSGESAKAELAEMQINTDPAKYVATRAVQDRDGYVWVQFKNQSGVSIRNVEISYAWVDGNGQTQRSKQTLRGPFAAGTQEQVRLKVKLPVTQNLDRSFRVQATSAEPVN